MVDYCYRRIRALVLVITIIMPSLIYSTQTTSTLQVQLPNELRRDSGYNHREALFGIPPYGNSIQQIVHYTGDDLLCDGSMSPSYNSSFILMIDRGGCTFVQKIRNGQKAGAAAVIIADNRPKELEPVMADDGSGNDVSIPSMIISKQDADPIKDALQTGTEVKIEMSWSIPHPSDHVEFELWTSPVDESASLLEHQWKDAAIAFKSSVTFIPHMYIYDGSEAHCRENGNNKCFSRCTNGGRYCSIDNDNIFDKGIRGADVVTESLRRICIWQLYGKNMDIGLEYWEYVRQSKECENKSNFTNLACVNSAMDHAGIDKNVVNQCMEGSGGLAVPTANSILQRELVYKTNVEQKFSVPIASNNNNVPIPVLPVIFVNKMPIGGASEFDVVFEAVCAGFTDSTKPNVCQCTNEKGRMHDCVVIANDGNEYISDLTNEGPSQSGNDFDLLDNDNNEFSSQASNDYEPDDAEVSLMKSKSSEDYKPDDAEVSLMKSKSSEDYQPDDAEVSLMKSKSSEDYEPDDAEVSLMKSKSSEDYVPDDAEVSLMKPKSSEWDNTKTKNTHHSNAKIIFIGILSGLTIISLIVFKKQQEYSLSSKQPEELIMYQFESSITGHTSCKRTSMGFGMEGNFV